MALTDLKSNLGPAVELLKTDIVAKLDAAVEDTKFIGDFLTSPQGIIFNFKQAGLHLANPKIEGVGGALTRVFNPLAIPANVAAAPFGVHSERHGLFAAQPSYEKIIKTKESSGAWQLPVLGVRSIQLAYEQGQIGITPNTENEKGFTTKQKRKLRRASRASAITKLVGKLTGKTPIATLTGLGGPNSAFGAGFTAHYRSNSGNDIPTNPTLHTLGGSDFSTTPTPDSIGDATDGQLTYNIEAGTFNKTNFGKFVGTGLYGVFSDKDNKIFGKTQPGQTLISTEHGQFVLGGIGYTPGNDKPRAAMEFTPDHLEMWNVKSYSQITEAGEIGAYTHNSSSVIENLEGHKELFKTAFQPGATYVEGSKDNDPKAHNSEIKKTLNVLSSGEAAKYNALTYDELGDPADRRFATEVDKNAILDGTRNIDSIDGALKEPHRLRSGSPAYARVTSGKGANGPEGHDGARVNGRKDMKRSFIERFESLETGEGDSINKQVPSKIALDEDGNISGKIYRDAVQLVFFGSDGWNSTQFRGYIKGLSDKFSPSWSETEYVGRPDVGYTYTKLVRDVSFSFMVAASNPVEMKNIWKKCNALASLVSPKLSGHGNMIGPVCGLRLGDYFKEDVSADFSIAGGIPGHISSLNFSIDDEFPWDLDVEKPMYVKIDISFIAYGHEVSSNETKYFGERL
jgi:hypothetical protein